MSRKYLFIALSFLIETSLIGQISIDLPSFTLNNVKIKDITTVNYAQLVNGSYLIKGTKQDTTAVDSTKGIIFTWSDESHTIGVTLNLTKTQVKLGDIVIKNMIPINKLNLPKGFTIGSARFDEIEKTLNFMALHPQLDNSGITFTSRVLTKEEFDYFKKNSEWGIIKNETILKDKASAIEIETIRIGCISSPPMMIEIKRE